MTELTDWYEPWQKPMKDRMGWYERKYPNGRVIRDWWNGWAFIWLGSLARPEQSLPWRGVKEKK